MEAEDYKRLTAEIARGDHDGQLANIMEAVRHRFTTGPGVTRWRLTHDGAGDESFAVEVTEDDLTLAEAEAIEKATGRSWAAIDPISSAKCCAAVLTVAIASRTEQSQSAAEAHVAALPVSSVVDGISQYEVNPAPLDSEPSPTP